MESRGAEVVEAVEGVLAQRMAAGHLSQLPHQPRVRLAKDWFRWEERDRDYKQENKNEKEIRN